MGHLAERNRDAKVIHKLPGRKPKIFLGNARWRQDRVIAAFAEDHGATAATPAACSGKEQAAGYCCDQPPGLLSQTFAASKFCSVLMYTALCTYDACEKSCRTEVIG